MRQENILIVEDERIIALDLQGRLIRFGYPKPVIATNGIDALKEIEIRKPDIILMDIMLSSGFDGIETANIIHEKYNIPIIFLTAYSDEGTLERAKRAGPVAYLLKPFKERELFTTIEMALFKFKADEKAKRQERWSAAILRSIGDGIIATNQNGNIDFLNPKAEKILGVKQEDVKNLPLSEIFNPIDSVNKLPIDITLTGTGSNQSINYRNCVIISKNGNAVHIEGSMSPIIDKFGNIEGKVVAFRDISRIQKLTETVSYQESHDALTGLMNRKGFTLKLAQLAASAKEGLKTHAFLYMDLDQFKVVNDIYGHKTGDEMLLKTTETINSVVRSSDTCARLGSDEFGIILEGAQLQHALFIGERLQSRLKENKIVREKEIFNISASIGLVIIDEMAGDAQKILSNADEACNIAKDEGGKRIIVYNDDENLFVKRRDEMAWIPRLKRALKENQFELFYQPIQATNNNEISKKCEILIRLFDGNEYIPPSEFLPSAERYNLMPAIDRWVITDSFNKYKLLTDIMGENNNPYMFSVNLSPEFLADEASYDFIIFKIEEFDIPPSSICFEITETAAISNIQTATDFIRKLKKNGCYFSLDDFGSGFSSFNYLKNLPVDFLKIDGIFVRDMDEDEVNRAMVEAINSLGHVIGLKTIAEFVKNKNIIEHLKDIKVDYLQGYEIGKPEPLANLIKKHSS